MRGGVVGRAVTVDARIGSVGYIAVVGTVVGGQARLIVASTGAQRLGGVASRCSVVGRAIAVNAGVRGVGNVAVMRTVV